ncbi:hypothetical protein C4A76_25465, partial [Brevibacillus laterosporus]|uniref:helix-turn-helix domain-containing protein n=1 Tax=Brevibacillus laterosporus TaxID=1465 RepID=UPI000D4540E1
MSKDNLQDTLRVFVVPTDILKAELTIHEKMTYVVIRSFANAQDSTAFPSYGTIAEMGSMSRRQAIRCVDSLVEKGLLSKKENFKATKTDEGFKVRHTSNTYTIHTPNPVVTHSHQESLGGDSQSLGGDSQSLGGDSQSLGGDSQS